MSSIFVIWILFCHWVGDFVLQNDYMSLNKSHDWMVLLCHSFTYFNVMVIGYFIIYITGYFAGYQIPILPLLFIINFPAHFIIDGITSRINVKLYEKNRHRFFTMIGFDQFLHFLVLFWTLS